MNNFDDATFRRLYRKAISLEQSARNVPPQLRPKGLAKKFSLTEAEVKTALSETPGGAKSMQHFNPKARGIVIEPTADGSILGNEFSEWTTGEATECVMAVVKANRCQLRNSCGSYGGGHKGNVCVGYGSPTEALWGSTIDVWASGCGVGVKLTHKIGRGNTIIVHHNGDCDHPIDVGPNLDLNGNTIEVHDAKHGIWTTVEGKQ